MAAKKTVKVNVPSTNMFDAISLSYELSKLEGVALTVSITKKGVEVLTIPSRADMARACIDVTVNELFGSTQSGAPDTGVIRLKVKLSSSMYPKIAQGSK